MAPFQELINTSIADLETELQATKDDPNYAEQTRKAALSEWCKLWSPKRRRTTLQAAKNDEGDVSKLGYCIFFFVMLVDVASDIAFLAIDANFKTDSTKQLAGSIICLIGLIGLIGLIYIYIYAHAYSVDSLPE